MFCLPASTRWTYLSETPTFRASSAWVIVLFRKLAWSLKMRKVAYAAGSRWMRARHITAALDDVAAGVVLTDAKKNSQPRRYSYESMTHMRATVLRLFEAACLEELVTDNPAKRVKVPEVEEVKKPRPQLTDVELAQLVAHPEVAPEIKLLVLLSRTIGGLRTGDLNRLDWTAFGPDFATCTFIRRKTRRKKGKQVPETHVVPVAVRAWITAWWAKHGQPTSGPVFPVRKGKRAGEAKKASKQSYAKALRRALLTAGIVRHELHNETASNMPLDFHHSTRGGFADALDRSGVNEQTALLLTGHSDSRVHRRYLDQLRIRELPAAAVPLLDAAAVETVLARGLPKLEAPIADPGAGEGIRTLDVHLGKVALYH
jgi:integrase